MLSLHSIFIIGGCPDGYVFHLTVKLAVSYLIKTIVVARLSRRCWKSVIFSFWFYSECKQYYAADSAYYVSLVTLPNSKRQLNMWCDQFCKDRQRLLFDCKKKKRIAHLNFRLAVRALKIFHLSPAELYQLLHLQQRTLYVE